MPVPTSASPIARRVPCVPSEHRLDVLLPVRGDAPWLEEALLSLAHQEHRADRVLLIDDGLRDRSRVNALGRRLLGGDFVLLDNAGTGISSALNTGVAESNATWVARMDADDVAHRQRFSRQLHLLEGRGPEVVGCGTQVRLVDEHGRGLGFSRYPTEPEVLAGQLLRQSCFAHPSMVFRRDALMEVPYRAAMDGAEDVDLVLRLAERWQLRNLDASLLDYRIHVAQENYRGRARQTALQELAFRLADARRADGFDPLEADVGLAERFVTWRLQEPGYVQARQAMTAMRYLKSFLRAGNLSAARACLERTLSAGPWRPEVFRWISRVYRHGPGAVRGDVSPFVSLNVVATAGPTREGDHA